MSRDIDQKCCIYVSDIDSECDNINNYLDKDRNNTVSFTRIDRLAVYQEYTRYTVYHRPFSGSMSVRSHRVYSIHPETDDLASLELMYESEFGGPFNNHGIKQIDDIV